MNRRHALTLLGSGLTMSLLPPTGYATDDMVAEAMTQQFGQRPTREGRISLELPALAESGNSVSLQVTVESPMSPTDRCTRLSIFANQNPRAHVTTVSFGANAPRAAFSTNIRLSGTQDVIAVAEMSDGSLWRAQRHVLVTVGACDALQMRR